MPFSSGTFTRTFDCTTDRDNGVKILASKFDTEFDGIATGLSTCILKDGTQTCTAAIPFAEGLTVPDNKTIVLGTNSDITIQYDETTNDSLEIAANVEGAALGVVLKADQGDDNADQHKLNIADGGVLTLQSKISGGFVTYLTHTPNSTVADSTTAVAGNLTVAGDLTLGSGAVINEAELEAIDGITAGTVAASKAVIVDSNKDIASFRNVTLTGELDAGSLDISGDADIDGTLEADAMTLNGTAITATATLDTGISNNNVPKFTSGVADNDFLRVDGTAIEGRSASEVLSDIGAAPAAGDSNIVTTGALDSGSITSGFGSIDNGSSNITTTGVGSFGSLDISGDIDVDGTTNLDNVDIDGTASIAGHASIGVDAVDASRALTVAGSTDDSSASALVIYNSSLASQFSVRNDGLVSATGEITTTNALSQNSNSIRTVIGNDGGSATFGTSTNHQVKMFTNNTHVATLTTGGNFNVLDGDLVIGTSGHGIDFSANSNASGMTSELLDSYEKGTFTPFFSSGITSAGYSSQVGTYVKVGSMVICSILLRATSGTENSDHIRIGGLPFAFTSATDHAYGAFFTYNAAFWSSDANVSWLGLGGNTTLAFYLQSNGASIAGTNSNVAANLNASLRLTAVYRTDA